MYCDTHCHLDYDVFKEDIDEVMQRSKDVVIVSSVVEADRFEWMRVLSRKYQNLYLSIGLAPQDLQKEKYEKTKDLIREHRQDIVAVGEVGLDHHWIKQESQMRKQEQWFREFIKIAQETRLPLVIHSREAEQETINILQEHKAKAIMHCFSGTPELAEKAIAAGALISIPSNVTYVKTRQKLAKKLPLESMVLETDSPYLAPVKGQRNEPWGVKEAAKKIAQLKGVSLGQVRDTTTENALRFYGLEDG